MYVPRIEPEQKDQPNATPDQLCHIVHLAATAITLQVACYVYKPEDHVESQDDKCLYTMTTLLTVNLIYYKLQYVLESALSTSHLLYCIFSPSFKHPQSVSAGPVGSGKGGGSTEAAAAAAAAG